MSNVKECGPWLRSGETLVCLGDSLTAAANGYVRVLQERLDPRGVRVINAGVGGDKTIQGLMRLERDVMARKPDAVSIFLGNNDCIIGRGEWGDEPIVSPRTFQENLQWMVHMMRLMTPTRKFSINTMTPRMEGRQYDDFGDVRREYNLAARRRILPRQDWFPWTWSSNGSIRREPVGWRPPGCSLRRTVST